MISIFTSLTIFFFLFGLAIGSFLNVVILRYNTGMGLDGRSQCFSCGKQLHWYELIPLFSYLGLRGKCSECKSTISWQYPAVELATGIIFAVIFQHVQSLVFLSFTSFILSYVFSLVIFCVLIVIFVYDLRHKIIPDGLSYSLSVLGLIGQFIRFFPIGFHAPSLIGLLAGPILFAPFALLWLISRGQWMGFGDAKLALAFGWILGLVGGLSAIVFAFWVGAVVSILILVIQKMQLSFKGNRLTMKSEIPFAPFLIIGFSLVYFFHIALPGIASLSYLYF